MDSPSDLEKDQHIEDSSASDLEDSNTEDLSTSEQSDAEISTVDLVKQALGHDEADDEDDSSEDVESDEEKEETDKVEPKDSDDEADEPTEDEKNAWKPKTRKRFEKLQTQLKENREALEKAEVDAGHYRSFVNYLEVNRISQDEANELFNIGALLKNDPHKALEAIEPYYQSLLQQTGRVLPHDLQQQVQQGFITEQHAQELSQLRMREQTGQQLARERANHEQEQQLRSQQQTHAQSLSALSQWEKQWADTDPDYQAIKTQVQDRLELLLNRAAASNTLPRSPHEAVALAEQARSEVQAEFRKYRPKKPVSAPVDGSGSARGNPAPQSTLDVIRQTVGA